MSENRYSNSKNSYQPSRYKAQLNHQRAMRAGNNENKTKPRKNDDGYFISSRYLDRENSSEEMARQKRIHNDVNDKQDNNDSCSKQNGNKGNSPGYEKKPFFNGKNIVLIIAILLVLAVIILTSVQVINSGKDDNNNALPETQATNSMEQNGTQTGSNPDSQATAQGTTVPAADTISFVTPDPDDNNENGTVENDLYIWNNSIFEPFYGNENTAQAYAEAMNRYAENLGDSIKMYTMVIPSHAEMGLPKRVKESGDITFNSQAENIKSAYESLSKSVTPINCYNELAKHSNEYIYFRTDTHWTGLGAYYAYKSFAEATNQDVLSLDTCTKKSIDGFTGSLLFDIDSSVPDDTVEYWELPYETTNYVYYEDDDPQEITVYYDLAESGPLTYGVFIWGDQPLEVLSSDRGTGKKIAIVKKGYGNALAPYLTYNYDEVHVIDYRYWEGNLKSYCEENGITEILFANGIMSANSSQQIEIMDTLF